MKNDPTQLFRTQPVACTKPKLFVLQLGAPLTNRKAFMWFMYLCHVDKNTLPHPSSLVRIQHLAQRLCSGWRCRERLPEGCPGKHGADSLYKILEGCAYELLWWGPHKNEATVTEPTAFHSWPTPTRSPDQRKFACRQTAGKVLISHD